MFRLRSFDEKSSNQASGMVSNYRSNFSRVHSAAVPDDEDQSIDRSDRSGSQERINKDYAIPLKIYQHREVEVRSSSAGPEDAYLKPDDGLTRSEVMFHSGAKGEETSSAASIGRTVTITHGHRV